MSCCLFKLPSVLHLSQLNYFPPNNLIPDDLCTMKRACVCRRCCLSVGHSSGCCGTHSVRHQGTSSDNCATRSHASSGCCLSEFRHPPPPQRNCNGHQTKDEDGVGRRCSDSAPTSPSPNITATASNSSGSNAPSTRRYNRRVVLHPVRMTDNAEVNSLLREIMERYVCMCACV